MNSRGCEDTVAPAGLSAYEYVYRGGESSNPDAFRDKSRRYTLFNLPLRTFQSTLKTLRLLSFNISLGMLPGIGEVCEWALEGHIFTEWTHKAAYRPDPESDEALPWGGRGEEWIVRQCRAPADIGTLRTLP